MHYGHYMGMHWVWWLFSFIFLVTILLIIFGPVSMKKNVAYKSPMDILQKRYANGEIDTEEYERRKKVLERDNP